MNAFAALRPADVAAAKNNGTEHTISEILQQPSSWRALAGSVNAVKGTLLSFLTASSDGPIVFTGAGSSAYIGDALRPTVAALTGRTVMAVPTTDLVTHPEDLLPPGNGLVVSFGRSGNSPESIAAVERLRQVRPGYRHLAITCNENGVLAKAMVAPWGHTFTMPRETHDASLVMTSSFTTMYLAGLLVGSATKLAEWQAEIANLADQTTAFIDRFATQIAAIKPHTRTRIQYLGSGANAGGVKEMCLKMTEMSDGALLVRDETFMGLRHGPQVFVKPDSLVIAVLSAAESVRRYETDLLKELHTKGQGHHPLIFAPAGVAASTLPSGATIVPLSTSASAASSLSRRCPDAFLLPTAVVGGQMLATVSCMGLGLKPDAPSASGTISRVVQGVTLYPHQRIDA